MGRRKTLPGLTSDDVLVEMECGASVYSTPLHLSSVCLAKRAQWWVELLKATRVDTSPLPRLTSSSWYTPRVLDSRTRPAGG